jgi:hypothetical protein
MKILAKCNEACGRSCRDEYTPLVYHTQTAPRMTQPRESPTTLAGVGIFYSSGFEVANKFTVNSRIAISVPELRQGES